MMLGFYGVSMGAGDVLSRSVNWEERFDNLRRSGLFFIMLIIMTNLFLVHSLRYGDSVYNTVENSSVFSIIRMAMVATGKGIWAVKL